MVESVGFTTVGAVTMQWKTSISIISHAL